ncbi:MAG: hypothetical protein ACI4RC_02300 [Oscillospiraceae bacterium]
MSILKKTAAVLSAVMISATLFGCADTSYVMKVDDSDVNAGVYLNYASTELQTQISTLQQSGVKSDYLSQKVDGKDLTKLVEEEALKETKEYAAINQQFDKAKLKIDSEELKQINSDLADNWENAQKYYETQGISKDTVKNIQLNSIKRSMLFDYYYAKDGKEAVSDTDMTNYVNDNYLRYKVISIQKSSDSSTESETDSSSADDSSKVDEEAKKLYEEYLAKAKKTDFAGFDDLIEEYNAYVSAKQEAESSESDDTAADTTAENEGTDTADQENAAADETTATSTDASSETADPYENEQMSNFLDITDDQKDTTYGKVLTKIKSMKTNEVGSFEDENCYYIYIKGDVTKRTAEYIKDDTNHSTLLQEMKGDEFQSKIDGWVKNLKLDLNDKAFERYTVKEIYEKQQKASESTADTTN